jgi:NAD(P) transhydrogenase subunit alpha
MQAVTSGLPPKKPIGRGDARGSRRGRYRRSRAPPTLLPRKQGRLMRRAIANRGSTSETLPGSPPRLTALTFCARPPGRTVAMKIAVLKELFPGERRVAVVPAALGPLRKQGCEVLIERGAGMAAGFSDAEYEAAGASLVSREDAFNADCVLSVRTAGSCGDSWCEDRERIRPGLVIIGLCDPLSTPQACLEAAERGAILFSLELVPRITRAQSMDVLSSQANIAGYRAVLLAATALPRILPMMTTAAGTIPPAKALILGAGVAGLQAIATAKRLGAQVSSYDVRPAVKEQVQSLGAKFVELPLETGSSETAGGYAKAMDAEFYARQRELLGRVISESDIVISTALIPGQKAPTLITREMVGKMRPGGVIVDLAAERGGNCEATVPGETVVVDGVTILGPTNLPAEVPVHTSQLYARNILTFLKHLQDCGLPEVSSDDEICRETLVARGGELVHPKVRDRAGLPPIEAMPTTPSADA